MPRYHPPASDQDHDRLSGYRAVLLCEFVALHVSHASGVSTRDIFARTRSRAHIALARQVAMYIAHTLLRLSMTDVGECFGRDRTTVAHACAVVEDSRDETDTDRWISGIEAEIMNDIGPRPLSAPNSGVHHAL